MPGTPDQTETGAPPLVVTRLHGAAGRERRRAVLLALVRAIGSVIALLVLSDVAVAAAYFVIPLVMWLVMRRNPAPASAAVAVLLALALAGAFAWRAHAIEQRRLVEKQQQEEELKAGRREAALEKALQLALGGDLAGAERSIGDAEALGASAGDVRLMRGQRS